MLTKICKDCEEPKTMADYYFNHRWNVPWTICKSCVSKDRKAKYVSKPRPIATVSCKCGETDKSKFNTCNRNAHGFQNKCKKCSSVSGKKFRAEIKRIDTEKEESKLIKIRTIFKQWCETGVFDVK